MYTMSEYTNKKICRLSPYQKQALSHFLHFLSTRKNLKSPSIKVIPKRDFESFKLYLRKPLYYHLSKSLIAYVD